jgi:hypothetical protein
VVAKILPESKAAQRLSQAEMQHVMGKLMSGLGGLFGK